MIRIDQFEFDFINPYFENTDLVMSQNFDQIIEILL